MSSILLIEDNADMQLALRGLLEADSHHVYTASDGETGFSIAIQRTPDIIITDYMMPLLDGVNLASRLRGNPSTASIGIILISAFDLEREQILSSRADIHLQKPFDYNQLADAIKRLEEMEVGLAKSAAFN
jgi:CheY-like chemotaxis protein